MILVGFQRGFCNFSSSLTKSLGMFYVIREMAGRICVPAGLFLFKDIICLFGLLEEFRVPWFERRSSVAGEFLESKEPRGFILGRGEEGNDDY